MLLWLYLLLFLQYILYMHVRAVCATTTTQAVRVPMIDIPKVAS